MHANIDIDGARRGYFQRVALGDRNLEMSDDNGYVLRLQPYSRRAFSPGVFLVCLLMSLWLVARLPTARVGMTIADPGSR